MSNSGPQQLLLGFRLDDAATLENFVGDPKNRPLLQFLTDQVLKSREQFCFLWGRMGTGKTHLLQALCHEKARCGGSPIYIPLAQRDQLHPGMLEGLERLDLVCLDEVDSVVGHTDWEHALFGFYNRAREQGVNLVFSATRPPAELPFKLADLRSRLQTGVVFQVHDLTDGEKSELLRSRAARIGVELPEPVIDYILQRHDRSVAALTGLIQQLDTLSLEQQRRITIPLVRQILTR